MQTATEKQIYIWKSINAIGIATAIVGLPIDSVEKEHKMIQVGSKVKHNFPSMLHGNIGKIVGDAGVKYKHQYWLVEWKNNETKIVRCAFADFVLYPASQKRKEINDGTLSNWLA